MSDNKSGITERNRNRRKHSLERFEEKQVFQQNAVLFMSDIDLLYNDRVRTANKSYELFEFSVKYTCITIPPQP